MKKLLLLLLVFLITSCSKDKSDSAIQELASVTAVDLPERLVYGQAYEFEVHFKKTTGCHYFSGFDVSKNNNTIVVGVVNSLNTNSNNCNAGINTPDTAKLNFVVERLDFYIFKFWQGNSSVGEDRFLTKEIPIVSPEN